MSATIAVPSLCLALVREGEQEREPEEHDHRGEEDDVGDGDEHEAPLEVARGTVHDRTDVAPVAALGNTAVRPSPGPPARMNTWLTPCLPILLRGGCPCRAVRR